MLYSHVIDDALDTSVGAKGLSRGIDAFDQLAVEESKVLTRQYLSQRRKS